MFLGNGKVMHSLEELEARMRGAAPPTVAEPRKQTKTEEDLSAFKKLVRKNLNFFVFVVFRML